MASDLRLSVYVCACVCVCLCMCVCVCAQEYMCVHACGGLRTSLCVILQQLAILL